MKMTCKHLNRGHCAFRDRCNGRVFARALSRRLPFSSQSISARSSSHSSLAGATSTWPVAHRLLSMNPYEVRGDVLGRAQNEPSCAISTRNPQHILCGSNDYRMVDVPGVTQTQLIRDAWLGVFQSADGGDKWESTLYGGFFLDPASHPLKTLKFQAAADPVVRSGPAGMAFYTGIAFTGDKSRSALHVSTYLDLNNSENDDMPFKVIRTSRRPSGQITTVHRQALDVRGGRARRPDVHARDTRRQIAALGRHRPGKVDGRMAVEDMAGLATQDRRDAARPRQHRPRRLHRLPRRERQHRRDHVYPLEQLRADIQHPVRLNPTAVASVGLNDHGNGAAIAKPLDTGSPTVVTTWRRVRQTVAGNMIPDALLASVSTDNGQHMDHALCRRADLSVRSGHHDDIVSNDIIPQPDRRRDGPFLHRVGRPASARRHLRLLAQWITDWCGAHPDCDVDRRAKWSSYVAVPSMHARTSDSAVARRSPPVASSWHGWTSSQTPRRCSVSSSMKPRSRELAGDPSHRRRARVDGAAGSVAELRHRRDTDFGIPPGRLQGWRPPCRRAAAVERHQSTLGAQGNGTLLRRLHRHRDPTVPAARFRPRDERRGRPTIKPTIPTPLGPVPVMPNLLVAWSDNRDMRAAPGVDNNPAVACAVQHAGGTELAVHRASTTRLRRGRSAPCRTEAYKTGTTNQNTYAARLSVGFVAAAPGNNKELGALQRAFVIFVRNDGTAHQDIQAPRDTASRRLRLVRPI